MKLFIDIKNRRFIKSAASSVPITSLVLKRRDEFPVEVVFCENGATVESDDEVSVGIKSAFSNANFIALAANGTISLYTNEIEALFTSNPASVQVLLEVKWGDALRTVTLEVELQNSVHLGSEGTPTAIPDQKATQADAEAGTSNTKWMTPLRTNQAFTVFLSSYFAALPTSDPEVAGALWNNGGIIAISEG